MDKFQARQEGEGLSEEERQQSTDPDSFIGEEISSEHLVRILSELSETELTECSLIFQYVSAEQEAIVLLCQNDTTEQLFFLAMNSDTQVRRVELPSQMKELRGEARKIFRDLPDAYRELIKEHYQYLRQTAPAVSTAEKRARKQSSKKSGGKSIGGIHRRHKHRVLMRPRTPQSDNSNPS